MKIKITKEQFRLLLDNLHLIGNGNLQLKMDGKTFKKIMPDIYPINEHKMYRVNMWFGSHDTITLVFAHNSAGAKNGHSEPPTAD